MSELFLIAHSVRGEAAFDVAVQMECPHCRGTSATLPIGCFECDSLGYWWIIPTSGHRAYPYACQPWHAMDIGPGFDKPMPPNWPDHYKTKAAPTVDIMSLFKAQHKGEAKPHIPRRL